MNFSYKIFPAFSFLFTFIAYAQSEYVVTSDSVKLHIAIKGKGPSCLYIHGGPGSGSYWLEKFVGNELEQNFQMIYLDQRGVGRSSSPKDGNYSLQRMVQDFEEVRQNFGIETWLTLGHSVGGIMQMEYVMEHQEVIDAMIFINCSLSLEDSFGNSWLPKAIELAAEDTPELCLDKSISVYERMLAIMPVLHQKGFMWKIFFASEENSQKMNETYKGFAEWNTDFSEVAMGMKEFWKDYRPFTPKVKQPVLFFYGNGDWAVGPNHHENIKFPNLFLWESSVGHMPFLENKQDLIKAINSFVQKNSF